tara:strand:+ start:5225 stop:6697 length:1473 start_codon:yes stop_codon:yes gene_type:complete
MKKKVAIIGSGIAGLSLSIRLSKMGYDVYVYEKNSYPGGKLSSFKLGKFRFDIGPPLLTMPNYIDELFELFGEDPRKYFNYKKKEIGCKYFWEDGIKLNAYSNRQKFLDEVNLKLGINKNILNRYLNRSKKKYNLTASIVLEKSLHKLKTYLSFKTIKALLNFYLFDFFKTLASVNEQQLVESHIVQFYNRFATYNGSSPYQTSGIMTVIQHLESNFGTFVPFGGMINITKSLYDLAIRKGVKFNFNRSVEKILHNKKTVTGIKVKGLGDLNFDVIVSNMDIFFTYKRLLSKIKMPINVKNSEPSSSALIFYWGIKKKFNTLDLHNIFFSKNYKQEFDSIFKTKTIYQDPTVYINITCKDNTSDSPSNSENWYVMINTYHDNGQNWDPLVKEYKKIILNKIKSILGESIEDYIVEEKIITPKIIEDRTLSYKGALYGPSSNNKFSAFLRHPNYSRKFNNLYFCGGSVHPGGGIPMCLLSSKIVSELISKN